MSARHTPGTESEQAQSHSTADQACRECRRRKSKCDRIIPICHLCSKFSRRCTYEKPTRTPLTRTHLTRVEAELAHAKALLSRLMPEDQGHEPFLYENHNGAHPDEHCSQFPLQSDGSMELYPDVQPVSQQVVHTADNSLASHRNSLGSNQKSVYLPNQPLDNPVVRPTRPESAPRSVGTTAFSLDTPPSSNNFEWDERPGTVGGDKFIDGMASLPSRCNEGGYLGSASGAALLRLTDTRSASYESDAQVDYRRHSNIPFALTSMSQLEPFIDAYFRLYHCSYPIIHEATFRAQFMEIIPRPSGNAWHVMLFVISTLGVFTTATQPTETDLALFDAAKSRLSIDVLETGNLTLVQALTLIANYLQKRNKPNSGYNYMGLARRVAMGIGLHKEFPTWDATLLTLEMRRRVWYCLYIFDIGAMITFSRPLDFPAEGVDVQLPLNAHDSDITAATRQMPTPAPETTTYTHLRAQAMFHLSTSHIYSKIISRPFPSATELIEMDDQFIGRWLAELPSFFNENAVQSPKFTLCHAILRWRYRNFRILIYRPFLVGRVMSRVGKDLETVQTGPDAHVGLAIEHCLHAAQEAVELISDFWRHEQRTMMACWYGLYFLFQAILIPVICLRNDPLSSLAEGWRSQILQAVEVLESMASLNPTAQRCLGVIQSLCGTYLQATVDGAWDRPTDESPQTQLANLYPLMWPTLELGNLDGGDSIIQESTIIDFMNQLPVLE